MKEKEVKLDGLIQCSACNARYTVMFTLTPETKRGTSHCPFCGQLGGTNRVERTARARPCRQLDGMGTGCSESTWIGGNYGMSVCHNPEHHKVNSEG